MITQIGIRSVVISGLEKTLEVMLYLLVLMKSDEAWASCKKFTNGRNLMVKTGQIFWAARTICWVSTRKVTISTLARPLEEPHESDLGQRNRDKYSRIGHESIAHVH